MRKKNPKIASLFATIMSTSKISLFLWAERTVYEAQTVDTKLSPNFMGLESKPIMRSKGEKFDSLTFYISMCQTVICKLF